MNLDTPTKDIFGLAVESYFTTEDKTPILVHHEDFFDDEIPVEYLFRSYSEMPELEQKALDLCQGSVLDVGCCAGSHSLELQSRGHSVLPIDISEKCIETCKRRGLKEAKTLNFFDLKPQSFDTLLLLMNGTGIAGTLNALSSFFEKLKSLMHKNSQVLLDSSDLIFLYDEEMADEDEPYYGEMTYKTSYKNQLSDPFPWLYLDFKTLKKEAEKAGLECSLIFEDDHYGYLAKLNFT